MQAYVDAAPILAEAPNSLGYDVAGCVEEPGVVVVRMRWDSAEGHLKGFRGSGQFRQFFVLVRPFFDAIEEMRHYEPVFCAE